MSFARKTGARLAGIKKADPCGLLFYLLYVINMATSS